MAISLLEQLMSKTNVGSEKITSAQDALDKPPVVELKGVNAPEFEDSVPFDMEDAYAQQPQDRKGIQIPQHDDGLDDDDADLLTPDHVTNTFEEESWGEIVDPLTDEIVSDAEEAAEEEGTENTVEITDTVEQTEESTMDTAAERVYTEDVELGEDGEPVLWNLKPFNSQYFNFGGRTVNALTRAELRCFDDIKGMAYSELKALKGFGQGCLDEVVMALDAEKEADWLLKRKKKVKSGGSLLSVLNSLPEDTSEVAEPESTVNNVPPVIVEPEIPAESPHEGSLDQLSEDLEFVLEEASSHEEPVIAEPSFDDPAEASTPTDVSEPSEPEVKSEEVRSLKILAIGGSASLTRPGLNVASFEMVYADVISTICQQSSVPSISSIDFGKGWGALSTTIRMNGWPQRVDVLTVSKSFMGRPEILMELRLLADLVLES